MIRWLGDFLRFWWGLLYWNSRKTWFRIRGSDPLRCPCQNPSDSGRALDTRCDAAAGWNRPHRFRRVCPLLVSTPDGLRCSVDAAAVRPYWLRAAGYAGLAALGIYLAGALTAFTVMRSVGYRVGALSVFWPGNWQDVREAQEQMYARRAKEALASQNFQGAILALEMVCQINPRNESAALALANLWQVSGRTSMADSIFARLIEDFPADRPRLAQIWYRGLLCRADFAQIAQVAPRMLLERNTEHAPWLHALIFATRMAGNPAPLKRTSDAEKRLPGWCNFILDVEFDAQKQGLEAVRERLMRPLPSPDSPYMPYYQADELLRLGRPNDALAILRSYGSSLPPDEAAFLRLRAYNLLGWKTLAETEEETLLSYPPQARLMTEFSAHLIRYPDTGLLARFVDRLRTAGPTLDSDTYPLYAAVCIAAARCGDGVRTERLRADLARTLGEDPHSLNTLTKALVEKRPVPRIDLLLPSLPLPTDVVYALLEVFHKPSP